MTATTNNNKQQQNDIHQQTKTMQEGQRIRIIRGRLQGSHGAFVGYIGLMSCRVLIDGNNKPQTFRRTSVEAAMVHLPVPKLSVPLAPPARKEPMVLMVLPEGPPPVTVTTLQADVQALKALIDRLETNLRGLSLVQSSK
jgi:hypothetical protein